MRHYFVRIKKVIFHITLIISALISSLFVAKSVARAQTSQPTFEDIRTVYTAEFGVTFPTGFAFLPIPKGFLLWGGQSGSTDTHLISEYEHPGGSLNLPLVTEDPLNTAYNSQDNSLFVLNSSVDELVKISLGRNGLPNSSANAVTRHNVRAFGIQKAQGITFDPSSGSLFILDPNVHRIISVTPHPTKGFDGDAASHDGRIKHLNLRGFENLQLRGIAYNPKNAHYYVAAPTKELIYELDHKGQYVSTFDLSSYELNNIQALTFAPSADQTDDPAKMNLFILDGGMTTVSGQNDKSGQILELTLEPMALPPGTTLLPSTLVRTFLTTNAVWNPSSPDPSGIDYWPPTGGLIIDDSEVDEMSVYAGKNVYISTLSGTPLTSTCNTTSFTREPTGMAVNPNNNHIFLTDDDQHRIYEISLGSDGIYCTSDDTVTTATSSSIFGANTDEEDVAYGANTLFISGGTDAEVYQFNLGPNGVMGGGDDGPVTHFDTGVLGFQDLEGIGYNQNQGTLFIVSTSSGDRYLGEVSLTGTLLRAYDLAAMGSAANLRSDVGFLPSSQNPANKNIYIVSRGIDNDSGTGADPNENDGKVWEFSILSPATATPTNTATLGPSPTSTSTALPTNTPTNTATPGPTATFTPTPSPSSNPLYLSMSNSTGSIGGVSFADEDILRFDGQTWGLFFDGSDVGVGSLDLFAFDVVDSDTILMAFNNSITLGSLTFGPHDIVQFDASSVGTVTAGSFSMYFNGADVGVDTNSENIDAIDVLTDGRVLISTTSSPSVVGITGGADEDILAFTPSTLGDNTSGFWAMYFDGSDAGLADSGNEDVDALGVGPNGNIYLSTIGDFTVAGVSGANEDIFICIPSSLGMNTACTYSPSLYFDGSTWGQASNDVDAFSILNLGPVPTHTPTPIPTIPSTATNTPTPTNTFTPTSTPTVTNTPTAGPSPTLTHTLTNTPTNAPTSIATNTALPTSTSSESLLFSDGFESGNFSAWTITTTGGDGTATVQNSVVRAGSFSAKLSETANTGSVAYSRKSLLAPETNLTISGDFMITQEGVSGGNVPIFRILDSSSTRLLSLYRQNATNGQIWTYDGTTRILASNLMPLNTWVHFDLHIITNGNGASTIEVYMNGMLVIQTTTGNLGTAGVLSIQIGNDTSRQIFTLYADNISVQR